MSLFPSPNPKRERIDIKNEDLPARLTYSPDAAKIEQIVTVLDGGGLGLIKERLVQRFGSEVVKTGDGTTAPPDQLDMQDSAGSDWTVKRDAAADTAIAAGLHSVASLFGFKRIVTSRSTLYNVDSDYIYTEKGEYPVGLAEDRKRAYHDRRMARLDLLATGIGSAACMVSANDSGYQYQTLDPTKIWIAHSDEILLNGKKATADINNFEDATVIVIQLSSTGEQSLYLAFHGRSEDYPNGRLVKYEAATWNEIPEPGTAALDYTTDGEFVVGPGQSSFANPLTVYQEESKFESPVEYPVFNWQMDATGDGTSLFPTSGTQLFDITFDLDTELSRNIESAGRSARGAWFVTDPKSMGFTGSPSEGETVGKRDQAVTLLSHPASNAQQATEILVAVLEQAAGAYGVPGYKVATQENMQVPSGFALKILNQPMTQDREMRTRINQASALRKYHIERALVNALSTKTAIPLNAEEVWTPGPLADLQTDQEIRDDIDWKLEKSAKSIVDFIQEVNELKTREEAMDMLERNLEENGASTPTAPTPPAAGILPRRGNR